MKQLLPRTFCATHCGVALSLFLAYSVICSQSEALESGDRKVRDAVAAAEKAYGEVDFAGVYSTSCPGLSIGNADVEQTVRLHVLCGISAAALGKDDEAKQHFIVALAIQPDLRLDRDLSPKIRGPYLEAQGRWGSSPERLSVRALGAGLRKELSLKVVDPARLASRIEVRFRDPGQSIYKPMILETKPLLTIVPTMAQKQSGFEYYARLVDEHNNALIELGSEAEPLEFSAVRPVLAATPSVPSAEGSKDNPTNPKRSYWLPLTLTLGGVASTAVGVYFNVRREDSAHQWNGAACEQPGQTRIQQCSSVNSDRVHAERAAIGFYAGGAALLVGGVTTWLLSGSSEKRDSHAQSTFSKLNCGVLPASIECEGSF